VFPLANEMELDILRNVLRYEGRMTAQELLKHPYFTDVGASIPVGGWIRDKEVFNPYFNYMSLV